MNLKISIVLRVCGRENGDWIFHLTQDSCSAHQKTPQYRISRSLNVNLSFGRLIYCSIPLCAEVVPLSSFMFFGLWGPRIRQVRLCRKTGLITNEWSWRYFYKILLNFSNFFPEFLQVVLNLHNISFKLLGIILKLF